MYVYILKSKLGNRHYIGSTSDIEKRIKMHNAGRVRSSKRYRPYDIIYFEIFATRSEAVNREYYFKTIEGYKYLKEKGIT